MSKFYTSAHEKTKNDMEDGNQSIPDGNIYPRTSNFFVELNNDIKYDRNTSKNAHKERHNDVGDGNQSTGDGNISCDNKSPRTSNFFVGLDNEIFDDNSNSTNVHNETHNDVEDENQSTYNENITYDNKSQRTSQSKDMPSTSTFYTELSNNTQNVVNSDEEVNEELHQSISNEDDIATKRKKSSCPCRPEALHPQPSMWHIACTKRLARQRLLRNKSKNWDLDGIFEPFKTFEVEHENCFDLQVTVHRGEGITKGNWVKDALDTPDPYIVLRIPQIKLNTPKRTRTEDNSTNPIWNHTFHFYLYKNPSKPYMMEISLMDDNYLKDKAIDTQFFQLDSLEVGIPKDCTFTFKGNSKVFITFLKQKNENTDLRFSMSLCDDEKSYLRQRRENVFESMNDLLGDDGPNNAYEVPTIGILGSGGGFRAMIGLSGALRALQDSGILDCVTYLTGISGSTWCISTLYCQDPICEHFCYEENKNEYNEANDNDDLSSVNKSTEELNLKSTNSLCRCLNVREFQKSLSESVGKNWEWNIFKMPKYVADMLSKYWKGQSMRPVTLVDIFGHLIGDLLLGKEKKNTVRLSELQDRLSEGEVPFPLFAGLHATQKASDEFSEWIEFSPYEIGMSKYGTFMKTEHFGSKFFAGKLVKKYDEMLLHYLQGMWGSAFTINLKRHLKGATSSITEDTDEFEDEEDSDSDTDSDDSEDEVEDSVGQMSYLQMRKNSDDKGKSSSHGYKKKNWFVSALENLGIDSSYLLNTRAVKPGRIYNPFRGLSLRYSFHQDRSTPDRDGTNYDDEETVKYADGCKFQPLSQESKKISVMDSGFAFNSPYPLLLRPQRGVDIFLSFDFSNRKDDLYVDISTFKQLIKAEEWAKERHIPFPPIKEKIEEYQGTELQECYVFESPSDSCIPVILHFPLVNNKFREYKSPGVLRSSQEELDFAKFPCFGKNSVFSTFKFHYGSEEFDRLAKLMEFNTLLHKDTIIKTIKNSIINKKQGRQLGIYEIAKILMWRKRNEKKE